MDGARVMGVGIVNLGRGFVDNTLRSYAVPHLGGSRSAVDAVRAAIVVERKARQA